MCNRYTSPTALDIERTWHVGPAQPLRWWDEVLFPHGQGPFIRRGREGTSRELVVGPDPVLRQGRPPALRDQEADAQR